MKSLILDLRLNPGGLLDQGVKVADLFLDAKQEIVATRGRARGSHQGVLRRRAAGLARAADRRAGERRHRQRRGDHRRRAAGSRPRGGGGHADLRQGPGADALPAGRRRRAQAHDRALVHAERPHHPAHRRRTRRSRRVQAAARGRRHGAGRRPTRSTPIRPSRPARSSTPTPAGSCAAAAASCPTSSSAPTRCPDASGSSPRRWATTCRSTATC